MLSLNWYNIDNNNSKRNNEREDPEKDVNMNEFDWCIAIHECHGHVFWSSKRHQSEQTRSCAPKRDLHDLSFKFLLLPFVVCLETQIFFNYWICFKEAVLNDRTKKHDKYRPCNKPSWNLFNTSRAKPVMGIGLKL